MRVLGRALPTDPAHRPCSMARGECNAAVGFSALVALTDCLQTGQTLGAYSVLLVPGVVNDDKSYEDCWRLSMEQIKQAIPIAQETGVQIAVENVWNGFLLSPLEAARYVDDLNA